MDEDLQKLEEAVQAVRRLISRIPIVHSASQKAEELIHEAAGILEGDQKQLEADLLQREQLGPVVDQQEGFGLFHARSTGTQKPQAVVLVPQQGTFNGSLRVILVTILPEDHTKAMQEVLSELNVALAVDEQFRHTMLNGSDQERQDALNRILTGYLHRVWSRIEL